MKMMEFQMKKNQKKDDEEIEKRKRMRLRGELMKEDEEEEEDWAPEPILAINYLEDGSGMFVISVIGQFQGFYYICKFGTDRPLKAVEMPKDSQCCYIGSSSSTDYTIFSFTDGSYQIRHNES
jgi:hypothetical protein